MRQFPLITALALAACEAGSVQIVEDTDGSDNPDDIIDTDFNPADPDGDGLDFDEEAENGTNPNKADSDGDGFSDKEEVDHDRDPRSVESWPYFGDGRLPCSAPINPFGSGDVAVMKTLLPAWTATDQFGQTLDFGCLGAQRVFIALHFDGDIFIGDNFSSSGEATEIEYEWSQDPGNGWLPLRLVLDSRPTDEAQVQVDEARFAYLVESFEPFAPMIWNASIDFTPVADGVKTPILEIRYGFLYAVHESAEEAIYAAYNP